MLQIKYLATVLLLASALGDVLEDTCDAVPAAPWEAALEDWVTAERSNLTRHGRIMSLAPSQGYYVTDRVDLVPPPPPRPHHPHPPHLMSHRGPYPVPHHPHPPHSTHHSGPPQSNFSGNAYGPPSASHSAHSGNYNAPSGNPSQQIANSYQPAPQSPTSGGPVQGSSNYSPPSAATGPQAAQGSLPYDEWQATPPPPPGAGKIVNRPPNPYKDQFKPSYAPPSQPIPVGLADRVDAVAPAPPQKQVSETDLYLLRAIEKLVYRVDLMEKRMRKMEENVHYVVAGTEAKPEPCEANFTRVGGQCYHFSSEAVNWKSASYACRKLKANLLELSGDERKQFVAGVQANKKQNGVDFWTGGLNPGLLWIWSHSATAVLANSTESSAAGAVAGEGRCLALVAVPAAADYVYRGQDCSLRHRYVCERDEPKDKLSNEIERIARSMRDKRKPKMADWDAARI